MGQTNYIKNTLNPSFLNQNEEFFLIIPAFQRIEQCKLEVQIIDHDNMSQGDLLGVQILTGPVLFHFLNSNPTQSSSTSSKNAQTQKISEIAEYWKTQKCEYNQKSKSVFLPLMKSKVIPEDLDQVSDVKGDIELKVSAFDPFNHYSGSTGTDTKAKENKFPFMLSTEQQSNFTVPHKLGSYPHLVDHQNKKLELLSHDLNAIWWEKELLEQSPHRLEREINYLPISTFVLTIHAAKGLANADLFGKSDPFVRILWNGVEVGTTTTIDDTLDPIWNEEFTLSTAPGQGIECCVLEMEVYDRDDLKEGDFLGSLTISGNSLKELSKASLSHKPGAPTKKSAGMKSYYLQKSSTKTEKENKVVKGIIHVSLKPIFSTSSRGLMIDDDEGDDSRDFHVEVEDQDHVTGATTGEVAKIVAKSSTAKPESLSSAAHAFAIAIEEPSSQVQKYHTSMEVSMSSISSTVGASFAPDIIHTLSRNHSILQAHVWFDGAIWYTLEGRLDPATKQIIWRRWEDQGLAATASMMTKGGSKWTSGTKSLVNQDVQKLVFSISTKITMEDHFLFVSVFQHSFDKNKHGELANLERSTHLVGGFFLTGSVLMDFMKITSESLNSNESSAKIWHSIILYSLPCLPSHPDVHDLRRHKTDTQQPVLTIAGKVEMAMRLVKEENTEDIIFLGSETSWKPQRKLDDERLVRISTDLSNDRIPWKFKFRKLNPLQPVKSQFSGSSARSGTSGSNIPGSNRDYNEEFDGQQVEEAGEDDGSQPGDEYQDGDPPISSRVPLKFNSTGDGTAKLPIQGASNALVHGRSRNGLVETNENKRSTNILIQSRSKREIAATNAKDIFKKDLMAAKANAAKAKETAVSDSVTKPPILENPQDHVSGIYDSDKAAAVETDGTQNDEPPPIFELKRFHLELAAMNFTLTLQSKLEEENRVYWRGKVTPKNMTFASEDMKHVVFATRSSRLLRNKDIDELEVLSEVHYVKEFGDSVPDMEKQASLPVCVKEIVSCGPGLVTRTFRIEMLTNTNILLGTTEVADDIKDFYRAVGVDSVAKVINKNSGSVLSIQDWDFTRIFEHIVEDRLEINMLGSSASAKQISEENQNVVTAPVSPTPEAGDSVDGMTAKRRKKAIFQANNPAVTDLSSSSVITIHRDPEELVEEFFTKGRLGLETVAEVEEFDELDENGGEAESTSAESSDEGNDSKETGRDGMDVEWGGNADARDERDGDEESERFSERDDGETSATPNESEHEVNRTERKRAEQRKEGAKKKNHKKVNRRHRKDNENMLSSSQSLVSSTSSKFKLHNLRLHSHTKRLTGKQFSCVVLLSSETERLLVDRPDYFFHKVFPDFTAFQPEYNSGLKLLFRCLDCQANKLHIITLPATLLWESEWLPGDFQFPDLSSKFRRDKLGARLLSYLSLRFKPGGECVLEVKIKKPIAPTDREDELNQIEDIAPDAPEPEVPEEIHEEPPMVENKDEDDFLFNDVDDGGEYDDDDDHDHND